MVIGLTGGIASGKTTVAGLLRERGATVIDADLAGHEVYRPDGPAWLPLIEAFGGPILGAGGEIDRPRLAAIVFGDPAAMQKLRSIVWPPLRELLQTKIVDARRNGACPVVLEAAVLLEAGWQDLVDEVWVVRVSPEVATSRLIYRSQLTEDQARARLAAQTDNETRQRRAAVVIDNSGSLEDLADRLDALWENLQNRVAKSKRVTP